MENQEEYRVKKWEWEQSIIRIMNVVEELENS